MTDAAAGWLQSRPPPPPGPRRGAPAPGDWMARASTTPQLWRAEELLPHSLRHHFGASLVSRGVSVAVSRWLGHSGPETTQRVYAHPEPDDEPATRVAVAEILSKIDPDVCPARTGEPSQ